ncbi:flavodoxin-like protein [Melghirimyces profundicolus]|uniref:Flavodoxin-like protein n=1 Tax=Melghirimyces profundicolus TaxID=1242148 RepID=A0A2T6BU37_9BACL|nr:flavodoxin-like protein [Melghirimyces profundicolus]
MKVLTVVTHPRINSLTFAIASRFIEGLNEAGHETEVLDLHRMVLILYYGRPMSPIGQLTIINIP